ncbi:MAG TPA: hypothetical protein VF601_11035 [Beijerinckiaceae bacterium]|jgi:hypothetical protein
MADVTLEATLNRAPGWRRFALAFAAAAVVTAGACYGFIVALDPYGIRTGPGRGPTPIMDLNQRFMYPQIVRSRQYDSALFGTSTIRLIDPAALGHLFGARFANLGLNAGTPWEQMQLAGLFLRHVASPKVMIFGLDRTWCAPDADRQLVTFRAFPRWLYDESRLDAAVGLLNLKSLEIAARVAMNRLGLMKDRIRPDGYEVFVPPDASYDLARARRHIAAVAAPAPPVPEEPMSAAERAALPMPALPWLADLLARIPAETAKILVFPPVHASAQPEPGTREADVEAECKDRVVAIARRHGATVVDFRRRSAVTTEDSNYWDPLHYRIGIARAVAAALKEAHATGAEPPDQFYRVLVRAEPPSQKSD